MKAATATSTILGSSLLLTSSSLAAPAGTSSTPQQQGPISLQFTRRAPESRSGQKLIEWASSNRAQVQSKYGIGQGKAKEIKKRTTSESLTNLDYDSTWIAAVDVGTPSKSYQIVLDTGSADFWVSASDLATSTSSSYKSTSQAFSLKYGSGEVAGYVATDDVTLADTTVNGLSIAIATQVSQGLLENDIDGIMGMGFAKLSASQSTPFWQASNSDTFSFYLERRSLVGGGLSSTAEGGTFTLGGINSSLYQGDISYNNVIVSLYWMIDLVGVTASGNTVNIGSTNRAAIDTGTTLIGGPDDVVEEFYSQISGAQVISGSSGYYSYPCSTSLGVTLTFGNKQYTIPDEDFSAGAIDPSGLRCMGAFFGAGTTSSDDLQWIVGDAFLKNVYSIFTNANGKAQVGFASLASRLNSGTTSTTVTTLSTSSSGSSSGTVRLGLPKSGLGVSICAAMVAAAVSSFL